MITKIAVIHVIDQIVPITTFMHVDDNYYNSSVDVVVIITNAPAIFSNVYKSNCSVIKVIRFTIVYLPISTVIISKDAAFTCNLIYLDCVYDRWIV